MSAKATRVYVQIQAVAKAMEAIIPEWNKIVGEDSEAAAIKRDQLAQSFCTAFYKSEYPQKHIDYDYAVELFDSILAENAYGDAKGFAERLNAFLESTAKEREVVVVVPLGFAKSVVIGPVGKPYPLKKPLSLGPFILSGPDRTPTALNKLLANLGSAPVSAASFHHHAQQSHEALGKHPLLLFWAHGSIDAIRLRPKPGIRHLIRLIELLGRVYNAEEMPSFGHKSHSRQVFVVNKQSGALARFPSHVPMTVSLPFSRSLVEIMKRPELVSFLDLLESGGANNQLINRLKNALNFFGRAIDEDDQLTRFLFLVIAMEAIFSRDKHAPIKATLADHVTILCFKESFRRQAHADLRDMYDVRSGIVHSGIAGVTRELLHKTEKLAVRAIYCSLALAVAVKDVPAPAAPAKEGAGTAASSSEGKKAMEDRFFDRLNEMKIGIVPNSVKLPPWDGYNLPEDDFV